MNSIFSENSQQNEPGQLFIPHVTLVGGLFKSSKSALQQICARLVQEVPGPSMQLDVCDAGNFHHTQCVYYKMVKNEGIRTLYDRTQALLRESDEVESSGVAEVEAYMPHMSLRYDCMAREEALKICAELQDKFVHCGVFRTYALELWDTTGPIGNWTCVDSYQFTDIDSEDR